MSFSQLPPLQDSIDSPSIEAEGLVIYNDRVREAHYERVRRKAARPMHIIHLHLFLDAAGRPPAVVWGGPAALVSSSGQSSDR